MTKEMLREALASVPGLKPVKTVQLKLLVISVHMLLLGMFLISNVSIFPHELFNKLFVVILLSIYFFYLLLKHGISYTAPSEIKTAIAVTGNELSLTVGNAITQTRRELTGGAGLFNARRKLDVIYPNRYLPDVVEV
jgi:hypothetical protein